MFGCILQGFCIVLSEITVAISGISINVFPLTYCMASGILEKGLKSAKLICIDRAVQNYNWIQISCSIVEILQCALFFFRLGQTE